MMLFLSIIILANFDGVQTVQEDLILQSSNNYLREGTYLRFDSLNLSFVGNWPFGNSCAVAYDSTRNLCFLASGGGVYIFDISDPSNPLEVSLIKTRGGEILSLVYLNNYLYITDYTYGFEIWDVTDQNLPVRLGGCEILGGNMIGDGAWGLAVAPPYAYVVSKDSGLVVVDITDPVNPYETARCYLHLQSLNVALLGNYAYVTRCTAMSLAVIDISDPTNPTYIDGCPIPYPIDVAIADSFAYVCCYNMDTDTSHVFVVNISTPSNPTVIADCPIPNVLPHRGIYGICVKDTVAYLASTQNGLSIANITDPYNPFWICTYDTPHLARDVVTVDTLSLIADGDAGLRVINVSSPSSPNEIGSFNSPGIAANSVISHPYLYLFDSYSGVYILDITDPQNPEDIGHFENPNTAISFNGEVAFPYLYLAECRDGLRILNISDPTNPTHVGACSTGAAFSLAIKDTFAYVADVYTGIVIINISDPSNPYIVASDTAGDAWDIVISGNYAYMISEGTQEERGFRVFDISDPLNPIRIGYYDVEGRDITMKDSFAFVAGYGLTILDVTEPTNPTFVSSYPEGADGVAVRGDYVFISVNSIFEHRIEMIDITDINNPVRAGYYETPAGPYGITVLDSLIFVSTGRNGLNIYTSPLLSLSEDNRKNISQFSLTVTPNPTNGILKIRVNSPDGRKVKVKLYDVVGRLVKKVFYGNAKIGMNEFWVMPEELLTGIYFVQLETPDYKETRKVILLK